MQLMNSPDEITAIKAANPGKKIGSYKIKCEKVTETEITFTEAHTTCIQALRDAKGAIIQKGRDLRDSYIDTNKEEVVYGPQNKPDITNNVAEEKSSSILEKVIKAEEFRADMWRNLLKKEPETNDQYSAKVPMMIDGKKIGYFSYSSKDPMGEVHLTDPSYNIEDILDAKLYIDVIERKK